MLDNPMPPVDAARRDAGARISSSGACADWFEILLLKVSSRSVDYPNAIHTPAV